MLLKGGTDNGNSTIYTADDSATQNLIKIGDIIKVTGTANNNGIYTVIDITTDGTALGSTGDVYYSLKGSALTNESSAGSTDPEIEVIREPGDKLLALGDVDSANNIDVWSNNSATDYSNNSSGDDDGGWTTEAVHVTKTGDDAQYIYYFVDEAVRICNINELNNSHIMWYGYIQRQQFGSSGTPGMTFSGWQAFRNFLYPPKTAHDIFSYCYVNSADTGGSSGTNATLGDDPHDNTDATNYYSDNRGVAFVMKTATSDLRFRANNTGFSGFLSSGPKTFLGDALDDADDVIDFGGNNGDGGATLVDSDGFTVSNATFVVSSGVGVLANSTTANGGAYLRLVLTAGKRYQVSFDLASSSNANGSVSLSASTSYDSNSASGSISSSGVNNNTLTAPYYADGSSSAYLHLKVESTTSGEHADFDNITVRRIDIMAFEDTNPTMVTDQFNVNDVITIGDTFIDSTCDYNNDPTITHDANPNIVVGLLVSGTGIPAGAFISSLNSTTSFELSASTTGGSVSNGSLTFNYHLGSYPKEFIFGALQKSTGGPMTVLRSYGGKLGGTAPHVYADADTPVISRGLGFNIGVSDGTADGDWGAGTYEFFQTKVYDGHQESLPVKMGDGEETTNIVAGTHTSAGGKALRISVYADVGYNGRMSGARIYTRTSGSDDDLILLLDIDIVKGVRTTLDGDHVSWSYQVGKGYYVVGPAGGNASSPNLDTYTTINGFSPDVHFSSLGGTNEIFKTSVIANRRAFIANVKTKESTGELKRYGDRIMYSEIGKFDTFLSHNFIDVSKGDYGEYVALETFADRLLAFKHNIIHIINIASPSVASWYLEDTIKYNGVQFSFSVAKTKNGIAWVSDDGCYLYDGTRVTNLIDRKIAVSNASYSTTNVTWNDWYRGTAFLKDVMLGYDPISNSLLMFRSPNDSTTNSHTGWMYDFDTGAWVYHTGIFTDNKIYTNFITDWNNNLTTGGQSGSLVLFEKFLPISKSVASQQFVTRDIDFGIPGLTKKIYKVVVTYKSDGAETTPFTYAIDGKQNFAGDGGGTFTGNFVDTSDKWDVVTLTPSSTISCQSIQIKFTSPSAGVFEINDMSIQYRVIRNLEPT